MDRVDLGTLAPVTSLQEPFIPPSASRLEPFQMALKFASYITSCFFLLLNTLFSLVFRLPIMSAFIKFAQKLDDSAESRAPLNTDGAKPQSGVIEKEVTEMHELIKKSPITLSELVSALPSLYAITLLSARSRSPHF